MQRTRRCSTGCAQVEALDIDVRLGTTATPELLVSLAPDKLCFADSDGSQRSIDADQVIVAKGTMGDTYQPEAFRRAGLRVHEVGAATGVGDIEGAMRDAMEAVDVINAG